MIIGVILRNFKNFRNQHYIPIAMNNNSSWLIGENGVGKSSILQALDVVLNRTDINRLDINNDARVWDSKLVNRLLYQFFSYVKIASGLIHLLIKLLMLLVILHGNWKVKTLIQCNEQLPKNLYHIAIY